MMDAGDDVGFYDGLRWIAVNDDGDDEFGYKWW